MKKISAATLGFVLLGMTPAAMADTIYDGFHVGVMGGYEAFSGDSTITPTSLQSYQTNLGGQGGGVGLQADYFRPFGENSHWGVEGVVMGNFLTTNYRPDTASLGYSLKHQMTTGGKAIYGYSVGGAMVYGTVGGMYSIFRLDGLYALARTPAHNVGAFGALVGAGVRVPITPRFMVTGEFTRTQYSHIAQVVAPVNGERVGKTKFDPVVSMFLFGITCKV